MFDWEKIFSAFDKLKVVVVGDVMLDNYWWGDVERISPEAPVPVVTIKKRESRLGGAANVALNCKALGAEVVLASVVGDDEAGRQLEQLCSQEGIKCDLLVKADSRSTTSKTRVLARNHQMIRLDEEVVDELSSSEEHPFIDKVLRYLQIHKPDLLIFEDYNKGLLKENIIKRIISHCRSLNILTAVDPKCNHFFDYEGVDIFKPNLKEVREALHQSDIVAEPEALKCVHDALQQRLKHNISFITLSEAGVFYDDGMEAAVLPTHVRNIADVSGAGDTVIATAALTYSVTRSAQAMAQLGNLAGGQVCEFAGVVPVNKSVLLQEAQSLLV